MADYREISQHYAQGAIKAVVLLNSGALVASLSQLDSVFKLAPPEVYAISAASWLVGTALGAVVWILAFTSTRHVDKAERGETNSYAKADFWMAIGTIVWLVSLCLFCFGGLIIIGSALC